ncbi:MAG: hypothetical protein K2X93_15840 [Candidatus Obscuribacterales bacterium]|nr:hypothetical protein [Candidatus Obscuribacterales bacterium]
MPFFESQKIKTKLVEEPAAVHPDNTQPLVVAPEDNDCNAIEQIAFTNEKRLPSRKTKPIDWKGFVSVLVLSVSTFVPMILLASDAASRAYVCGFMQALCKDESNAIASFSEALALRKDPIFFRDRAYAYGKLKPPNREAELSDFVSAIELKSHEFKLLRNAIDVAAITGQRQTALRICSQLAAIPSPLKKGHFPYQSEAAYNALLLDDSKLAGNLVPKEDTANDGNKKSDTKSSQGYDSAIRAMVAREFEQFDAVKKITSVRFSNFCSMFYYSNRSSGATGKLVPGAIETLLLLDQMKPLQAAERLTQLQTLKYNYLEYPIINLLNAWICYEQGDQDQCLRITDALCADMNKDNSSGFIPAKKLTDSVEGLNLAAAIYLLREHAFLDKHDPQRAAIEHTNYLNTKNSGKVFVPIPYRKWLH